MAESWTRGIVPKMRRLGLIVISSLRAQCAAKPRPPGWCMSLCPTLLKQLKQDWLETTEMHWKNDQSTKQHLKGIRGKMKEHWCWNCMHTSRVDRWRDRLYLTGDDSATGGPSLQSAFKGHALSSEPSEISKPITTLNVYLISWRAKCACNCMSRCKSEFSDYDTCIHHHLHLIPIASTARIAYWSGPRLSSWSPRRSHRSRYTALS